MAGASSSAKVSWTLDTLFHYFKREYAPENDNTKWYGVCQRPSKEDPDSQCLAKVTAMYRKRNQTVPRYLLEHLISEHGMSEAEILDAGNWSVAVSDKPRPACLQMRLLNRPHRRYQSTSHPDRRRRKR